jgi:hypothetical protein
MLRELDTAVLTRHLPEYRLSHGDIGALVPCYKAGEAFKVAFVIGKGETLALARLGAEDVRPTSANEILHVREIKAA